MTSTAKSAYPNLEEEQTEQLVEQQRPQLPPRIGNVQSSPAPYVPNQNIFAVLLKNARQISSLTAGCLILFGSGVHTVWAFWEIYSANSWNEIEVINIVGSWYLASIVGSAFCAALIPHWPKKTIYVSKWRSLTRPFILTTSQHSPQIIVVIIIKITRNQDSIHLSAMYFIFIFASFVRRFCRRSSCC